MRRVLTILTFLTCLSGVISAGSVNAPGSQPSEAATVASATQPAPIAAESTTQPVATLAAVPAPPPEFLDIRGQHGFWRIAKTPDGVWWFLSPADHREFLNLVTTVQPFLHGRDPDGANFISSDFDSQSPEAIDRWAKGTARRVLDIGFKGVGAWSNPALHKCDVPMTQDLNISAWIRGTISNDLLFSPEWSKAAEEAVRSQTATLRENHNLVGYYLDNEINWEEDFGPKAYFDGLSADDPNRVQLVSVIQKIWPDVAAFNSAWGANLEDWTGLAKLPRLPRNSGPAYDRLASVWLSHVSEYYFRITATLLRTYDPNHLILGVRYRGSAPEQVVRASRDFTDAQSLNYYVSDARLDPDLFRTLAEQSQQPVIISEYSFHALDGRSGDRNLIGFDAQVVDQQARADAYRLFTTRLARVPYLIGADWFQWSDEPSSGRESDGEDANFGVMDVDDRPYEPLVAAIAATGPLLNDLHLRSVTDNDHDVWRESFTGVHPVAKVPFLKRPIRLEGRLDQWPPECKIRGIRPSLAVGSERNTLPPPDVYLGWTKDGLYLGFQVFDRDISAAPASGWWWARDSVEFWVSTRPPRSDQTRFDAFCHHFFFVPVDYPTMTGTAGVVGQWHSPGDTIPTNLVPHPELRQVTRILHDRYVVEMFIPARALNGFDPRHQPVMAFNFHARDYQHAAEHFWSAPKQVLTQCRPNTWGILELENAAPPNAGQPIAETELKQ